MVVQIADPEGTTPPCMPGGCGYFIMTENSKLDVAINHESHDPMNESHDSYMTPECIT